MKNILCSLLFLSITLLPSYSFGSDEFDTPERAAKIEESKKLIAEGDTFSQKGLYKKSYSLYKKALQVLT
ncbi:MAG: hypothetical protein HQL29_04260 [Candidatus Omnitrophica bacterium]|nr:hypothetical protein [Candidatus Omnitrophota bacterium]